jgi:uncharacterized protein
MYRYGGMKIMDYPTLPMAANQWYLQLNNRVGVQGHMNPWASKLKVEGQGSIKVQPDVADIVLGVVTENVQLEAAQRENALRINAVINALKESGIPEDDIKTQSYTIDPQYDYVDGKQVFRGYRVSHILRITVKNVNEIGKIVDKAVASGANQVISINFSLLDPSRYYQRALEAAIDDAIAKAKTIGRKLNIIISQAPVQIVEQTNQPITPFSPVLLQTAQNATQIPTGQIEIIARIKAIFTYTPNQTQGSGSFIM